MSATRDVLRQSYNPYADRQNAPLPPVPTRSPSGRRPHEPVESGAVSPITASSPFSDNAYPAYPKPGQQPGAAADYYSQTPASPAPYGHDPRQPFDGRNQGYAPDPFDDHNAIPLQHQKPPQGAKYGEEEVAWNGQTAYDRDTERRSSRPRRNTARKSGWFSRPIPWVVYTLTLAQIIVFIAEIIRNGVLTGSPIAIHPQFNPMIGPSSNVLINMGSRFIPCMKNVHEVTDQSVPVTWQCPNSTSSDANCQLSDLCGFSGVPNPHPGGKLTDTPAPNQWFRFIVPIFMHAGLIHIGFNMLLQMTMGKEMEQTIGSIRFFLVYFAAGIFGFVLGGNFAATGISSTGASGAIFGILALTLLDLLYHWNERRSPGKELIFILLDVVIAFVLGLLPGLDNFSHIGGFLMGIVLGICLLRSPSFLQQRIGENDPPYSAVATGADGGPSVSRFVKQPVGFFKGRKPLWWVWWLLRAAALVAVLVVFIVLVKRFYDPNAKPCSWCKYLSCLPVNNWCEIGNLQITNTTKRDLGPLFVEGAGHAILQL